MSTIYDYMETGVGDYIVSYLVVIRHIRRRSFAAIRARLSPKSHLFRDEDIETMADQLCQE